MYSKAGDDLKRNPKVINAVVEKFKEAGKKLKKANKELKKLAKKYKVTWVDLTPALADENGELKAEFTNDGYHLMGKGYIAWRNALKPVLAQ